MTCYVRAKIPEIIIKNYSNEPFTRKPLITPTPSPKPPCRLAQKTPKTIAHKKAQKGWPRQSDTFLENL